MEPTDEQVEQFIEAHPGGATAEEVGAALGISKQRVHQIVTSAIAKALTALRRRGFVGMDDLPC